MASLQKLILSTGDNRAHLIPSRLFYNQRLSKSSHKTKIIHPRICFVHTPTNDNNKTPTAQKTGPTAPHRSLLPPRPRHEVHEGTVSLSIAGTNPPGDGGGSGPGGSRIFEFGRSPLFDAFLTTAVGLGMVFLGGVAYMKWYKMNVLTKIEDAFAAGYDPALELELAKQHTQRPFIDSMDNEPQDSDFYDSSSWTNDLRRKEQDFIDSIVHGKESGHYFVLLGPKGSGKGSMIFQSMTACQAEGIAMCDAHSDLEVFRQRLGKALNYEFNEDSQMGLFQRRDPREGGPGLDVERALNKLEKVALRTCQKSGRPLVLIINNVHHFKNDEGGRAMLLQLQQKAEAWAASGILTMVFSSDDFWPYNLMRRTASRMHTVSIYDLDNAEAKQAAMRLRMSVSRRPVEPQVLEEVVDIVGGRLSYLNKTSRSRDMIHAARRILNIEKEWLLSQIGLIPDCDDDVMDEQKWSSCSWLLLREFVKIRKEQEQEQEQAVKAGILDPENLPGLPLPKISYGRCRQIMTRPDFLEGLDHLNIISIDTRHDVRPESMLILHAAREVCEEEGFDELLESVRERIDEIESLHRTRELTFKDLEKGDKIRLSVDK